LKSPDADNLSMKRLSRAALLVLMVFGGVVSSPAQSDAEAGATLRFQFDTTDQRPHRLIALNRQRILVNGYAVRDAEIVTRAQIEPDGTENGRGRYRARFTLTESTRQQGQPVGLESEYESIYYRSPRGEMEVASDALMPVIRNFPVFPTDGVSPGDTWTAPAEEVHDLSVAYGIREPLRYSFNVAYRYVGRVRREGEVRHLIEAEYTIFHREQRAERVYPAVITGESNHRLYWDPVRSRVDHAEEEYWIEFRLSDGRTIAYQGTSETEVIEARPLDRTTIVDLLQAQLDEAGIENTRVTDDPDGVILVVEDIGFPPDSSRILPSEEDRLSLLAEILAQFPDNDILVTGHTALAGTAAGRQQLSIDRARAVGEYFLSEGIRRPEQVFFRGFGASQPIADNDTPEGRSRNRRVEVMVLDN
jgi:outer membrane protein OmpA-like peptidoglycan-associated protein